MIMILRYFILTSVALCAHGVKLHEHMTKQEIESTFNCDHRLVHEVEYEVTPVLHVDGLAEQGLAVPRSHSAVHLRAFDKNISLYLSENDHLLLGSHTPLFTAKPGGHGRSVDGNPQIVYSRMPFPVPERLKLYHDMENRAAVTVFIDDDNQAHVYGTVGEHYVIKPIPKRLHKEVLPLLPEFHQSSFSYQSRDPFSNDPFFSDPFSGKSLNGNFFKPTHHIVMKPKIQVNSAYYDPSTGRGVHSQQQTHNINIDDLKNQFAGWNSFKQPFARPSTTVFPKNSINYPPAHRQPFVPCPQANKLTQFNPTTKAPWHLPPHRFPTRHPEPKLPITQRPTFKQPATSYNTPVRRIKPVEVLSDTVYPELLISTDYETFEAHGSDLNELSKYMAAFWNAVDLRFRELSHPKVRLNIAGLIVPQTRDSAPYFENSRAPENRKIFMASETLSNVGKYFSREEKFPNTTYDIAVAMSFQNLGTEEPDGKLDDTTSGIARMEGACQGIAGLAAAVVRDKGSFNGITSAAHELGHLMGAPHDGDPTKNLTGGPCSWSDGYLMSYEKKDGKGMHWSRCSNTAMSKFLLSPEAKCMRNKPDVGKPYPKILPGKMLSRDEQCTKTFGAGWFSYKKKERNCAVLHCRSGYKAVTENRPPAEGSYCGEGSICLDAQCVKDPTDNSTNRNKQN